METGGTGRVRSMGDRQILNDFVKKYPTREQREEALKKMSNSQIDELIKASTIVQAKIYYSSFKKK